ncbi:hypothetical protein ACEQ6A_22755 [Rhizobium brockwellii]|uniref:hypothetical protein n=1 Tax=Rhizobium brockwellii TaxID=3019932 RepID=UPI003F96EF8A
MSIASRELALAGFFAPSVPMAALLTGALVSIQRDTQNQKSRKSEHEYPKEFSDFL